MISPETNAEIRRYFYAEHWKIGTIAQALSIHPDAVRHAIGSDDFNRSSPLRHSITDPYLEFVRQTLDRHPGLRATRIYQMICERGYAGSVVHGPPRSPSYCGASNARHPLRRRSWSISAATPRIKPSRSNLTLWRLTMNSPTPTTTPINSLVVQLQNVGLCAVPAELDDFLARAAKSALVSAPSAGASGSG